MSDPPQATCAEPFCDAPLFWTGRGRRPSKCPEHSNWQPKLKPGTKLVPLPAELSGQQKKRDVKTLGESRAAAACEEYAILRMAAALGISDDPIRAAKLGGVRIDGRTPTQEEAEALAELAMQPEFADARDSRPSFAAKLYARFLTLNAISLPEAEPTISAANRASAARMAQQVLEGLGGGKLIYSNVKVDLGKPRETDE